ncbi:glycosyltransferase [Sinorhizobium meliloti]|uniref:glycosyltransferase n=1 Tax=Rhizobium meliloti TaxID=382 RepID=UPI000FD95F37|nr:glycosyltransferase [Sinorhizobium meliloti]RVO21878.1 glycosyltransferase [Sinorhizobium meliloti]RVO45412.1 glycosyltransferase [Sinorhizobium meliloti]WQP17357.1 glycosyltransferase [Sinorhizobium meliloti]
MNICNVTVVIPTYNRVSPLKRALNSIARQTVDPAEVIIIDDCSEPAVLDEVNAIASEFSKQLNVTLLVNEHNRGANYARNRGIFAAVSNYVAFLDSDDLWLPEKLEKQVAAIAEAASADDKPILSATGRYRVDGRGDIIARQFGGGVLNGEKIRGSNFIGTLSSVVVDTSIARRIRGFDESLTASQDWDFFIRLSEYVQYVAVADPLCVYVDGSCDRITQDYRKKLRGHISIYRNHVRPLKGRPSTIGAELLRNIAEDYQELGNERKAASLYARALAAKVRHLGPIKPLLEFSLSASFCVLSPPRLKQQRYERYRYAMNQLMRDKASKATIIKDRITIQQLMAQIGSIGHSCTTESSLTDPRRPLSMRPPSSTRNDCVKEFRNAKHIALVIRQLGGRSGGAERIYCELANILTEGGYRVTCLHFDTKDTPPFYPISPKVELINLYGKVKTKRQRRAMVVQRLPFVSSSAKNQALWDQRNDFFLTQLRDYFRFTKPALAISLMPPANTVTLLAAAGTLTKVVATNHNVPREDYDSPHRWDPNPVDRKLRKEALDHAAAVHVLFPSFGEWFPPHLKERVVAIPNYISPEFAREPKAERDKVILAVGRLAEVKNYMQLVRSWAALANDFPDWKVVVYGTGPQLRELKDEIGKLGIGKSFVLGGHRSDLGPEYARAAIFCHPAHFEGFGLSPAEALYMSVPVVSYADCSGVNQFVKNGYNGLAVERSTSVDTLAIALRRLMEDQTFRESLGTNGPESMKEFTLDRYRANWIGLIETLTEGGIDGHA